MTALAVARLLVRFRWRSLWNGAWRVPRQRPLRVAWMLVMLAPLAYVGLFATAFSTVAETAPLSHQAALLAVVAGVILLASLTGKMASSEAVVGGSGENEFLLTRPIDLATLVVARSYAGVATSLFDALFLFPVLVAGALVWDLGLPGVLLAAVISAVVQVGVSALAQAGQILVVRLVPAARRRMAWSALTTVAALSLAGLWMVANAVMRRPLVLANAIAPWTEVLRLSPGGWIVEPLYALARGWQAGALLALAAPLELTVVALLLVGLAVRWAGRAGWEQAGTPWAEAARVPPRHGVRMTLFTKDWFLIVRDRSRLVMLVALPLVFIAIQVFGSIGWSWSTGSDRHVAVLAYSLAAYMTGFGPLTHMEAERRAFWLLRVAPVSLGRLLAWKAAFWSVVVGSVTALVAFGLLFASGLPLTAGALGHTALALVGAVTASCLAVAMGSGTADFSDDTRRAIGPGTIYLFLLVAGLFNVALLERSGLIQMRVLLLYAMAVGLHWLAGVEGARKVFDPEPHRQRQVIAADGATLLILLFAGAHAQGMAGLAAPAPWNAAGAALLAVIAAIYLVRRRTAEAGWPLPAAVALALVAGALAGAPWRGWHLPASAVLISALVRATADELIVRGIIQRGLAARGRWLAFAISAVVALLAGARPFGWAAVAVAVIPALALAATGRFASAAAARVALELAL